MYMHRGLLRAVLCVCLCTPAALAAQGRSGQQQQPARDTSAQKSTTPTPTGSIAGHVAAADNGKPLKRARVLVTAAELPGGRAAMTDETGAFEISELPAGRYTVAVSKSGFIAPTYGDGGTSRSEEHTTELQSP